MTHPGFYYCYNAATNVPADVTGGGLLVMGTGAASVIVQLFVSLQSSKGIYKRSYTSGAWGSWVQV